MKFSLLLYALGVKLKSAIKKSADFKARVKEQNMTLQIRTEDGKKGRYYIFKDGEITSMKGVTANPDVALVWCDAKTAFAVMSKGDQETSMKALTEGKLKLEGDGGKALWFTETVKQMKAL